MTTNHIFFFLFCAWELSPPVVLSVDLSGGWSVDRMSYLSPHTLPPLRWDAQIGTKYRLLFTLTYNYTQPLKTWISMFSTAPPLWESENIFKKKALCVSVLLCFHTLSSTYLMCVIPKTYSFSAHLDVHVFKSVIHPLLWFVLSDVACLLVCIMSDFSLCTFFILCVVQLQYLEQFAYRSVSALLTCSPQKPLIIFLLSFFLILPIQFGEPNLTPFQCFFIISFL